MKALIFFFLLMVGNIAIANVASNYDPDLMVKLNEIEDIFGVNIKPSEADILISEDRISNNKENYFQLYSFIRANQITIKNTLMVAKYEAEAERYYNEFQAGMVSGLSEKFSLKRETFDVGNDLKATFYTLHSIDNIPQGNFIIIKNVNRVFDLLLNGVYFENFGQFNEYLKSKVDVIFLFSPAIDVSDGVKRK